MKALKVCAAAVLLVAAIQGCALFSKSEPIVPRYFSPERPEDLPRAASPPPEPPLELRLGTVASAANLDELLVFRDSASEVGYYRLRRWTEAPEQYLSRRLSRVLFEERRLREVISGDGPTLDVELTAFEEIRGTSPRGRVQAVVKLRDEGRVRWEVTVTVEEPVAPSDDPGAAAVQALGTALRAVVDQIADRVLGDLRSEPNARAER